MASFNELKEQLEGSFIPEGSKDLEASIQINIEGLTNFFIEINDGSLNVEEGDYSDPKLRLPSFISIKKLVRPSILI